MTTNPFTQLDKMKVTLSLNEAYDAEIKKIQERRTLVNNWKHELNNIKKQRDKKRHGRDY